VARSFKDTEAKLSGLKVEAQNAGMKINSQKTKEMRVNHKNEDRLHLGGHEIEEVMWDVRFVRIEVPTKV
jgi:hypothetical protein